MQAPKHKFTAKCATIDCLNIVEGDIKITYPRKCYPCKVKERKLRAKEREYYKNRKK